MSSYYVYIKVHGYLLFCCVIRDYLALNVYVALCYYKLDYYDVSQASIIKFDFLFFCLSNLVPIKLLKYNEKVVQVILEGNRAKECVHIKLQWK